MQEREPKGCRPLTYVPYKKGKYTIAHKTYNTLKSIFTNTKDKFQQWKSIMLYMKILVEEIKPIIAKKFMWAQQKTNLNLELKTTIETRLKILPLQDTV